MMTRAAKHLWEAVQIASGFRRLARKPPGIKHTRTYRHDKILENLRKYDPDPGEYESLSDRAWAIANAQEYKNRPKSKRKKKRK